MRFNCTKMVSVVLIYSLILSDLVGPLAFAQQAPTVPVTPIPAMPKSCAIPLIRSSKTNAAPPARAAKASVAQSGERKKKVSTGQPAHKLKSAEEQAEDEDKQYAQEGQEQMQQLYPTLALFWTAKKNMGFDQIRKRKVPYNIFIFNTGARDVCPDYQPVIGTTSKKCPHYIDVYRSEADGNEVLLRMKPGAEEAAQKAAINAAAKDRGCDQATDPACPGYTGSSGSILSEADVATNELGAARGCDQVNDPTCPGYANLEHSEAAPSGATTAPDESNTVAASAADAAGTASTDDDDSPYILCDLQKDAACLGDYFVKDFAKGKDGKQNPGVKYLGGATYREWMAGLEEVEKIRPEDTSRIYNEKYGTSDDSLINAGQAPYVVTFGIGVALWILIAMGTKQLAYTTALKRGLTPGRYAVSPFVTSMSGSMFGYVARRTFSGWADWLIMNHDPAVEWFMAAMRYQMVGAEMIGSGGIVTVAVKDKLDRMVIGKEIDEHHDLSKLLEKETRCRAEESAHMNDLGGQIQTECRRSPDLSDVQFQTPRIFYTDEKTTTDEKISNDNWKKYNDELDHFITRYLGDQSDGYGADDKHESE